MQGGIGCGARGRASQARTRAASGLRPAGHYGLPARSLADGGRETTPEKRGPAPEGERRDGAPGGARVLERERGTQRTMVAPLGAPSPSLMARVGEKTGLPGASAKNTGDDAWLFDIGCLTIESTISDLILRSRA